MRFKPRVKVQKAYGWKLGYAIGVYDSLCREMFGVPGVVTSLDDGRHKPGSKHGKLLAFDGRIKHLGGSWVEIWAKAKRLHARLRTRIDWLGFDTVLEPDHIHCEWDPKRGEQFVERVK